MADNTRRVVFMGTPDFAVPSLQALLQAPDVAVVGVYTQPPRPAKRGQHVQKSAVQVVAEQAGVVVFTPEKLTEAATAELRALQPDLICVAAYGLLLPQRVLDVAPCLNVHPSVLPRWRGAAPIQHTVLAGDTTTDLCIMQMEAGLDTGPVYLRMPYDVGPDETAGELHDRMAQAGGEHLLEVVRQWPDVKAVPQDEAGVVYAHKITPQQRPIDWRKSAQEVHNHIRGLAPWPGATSQHGETVLKILRSTQPEPALRNAAAGEILAIEEEVVVVACGAQTQLRLTLLQRPGKKAMQVTDFVRGYPLEVGEVLV